jgi:DUF1680 family protein
VRRKPLSCLARKALGTALAPAAALLLGTGVAQAQVNLALVATPSASEVSGDTRVESLNDGSRHRNSRDRRAGAYGNWPSRGVQWVEYAWDRPIRTNRVEVYWWDDRQGVRLPTACRLLTWNGTEFVPVPDAQGLGVAGDQFNVTEFPALETTRLRLETTGDGEFSTGVLEWRVFDAGGSPAFPPKVEAGVDRVVVLGGTTYLDGAVRALSAEGDVPVRWSVASGPGEATFADATQASTTAQFTTPGRYALQFTAGSGDLAASDTLTVLVKEAPTERPLQMLPPVAYRVTNPLWRERLKAQIVSWIPHCIERISDPELREGGINNFVEAAKKLRGEPAEAHRGYVFSNAWVHNTVESMCLALMVDAQGDPEILAAQQKMRDTLEDWIPKILAAQEPDGYLHTVYTISGTPRWSRRDDHEGYTAGYFLEAAIAHYVLTEGQDRRLYDAAVKLADCWCDNIGPAPKKAWYDGHQAMEMALFRFGRFVNQIEGPGAGQKYFDLGKFLLDQRNDGSEYDQSHVPVVKQYEAVGHAVRASYSYAGMADVALETADRDYISAVESLWDNLINRKYYVTGGIGSGETSEGFGPDYSLRNDAYCESCSSCGELFFQHKLNLLHHDAKYADLYEETLYNAILGSVDLEGKNFYYQNPLTSRGPRYSWHGCPCCVGNIPRTLLMLPTWTYVLGDDGLYVNLFIGSEVTFNDAQGKRLTLTQTTDYPFDKHVKLKIGVEEPRKFVLRVRAPQREVSALYDATPDADGLEMLAVNGEPVEPRQQRGYWLVERTWNDGDEVTWSLPLAVQRVRADERIVENRDRVALRYGPLVYSLERADQDLDGALPAAAELATEWEPELLGGVLVIRGKFADGSPLTAIPNYARENRSERPAAEEGGRRRRGGPNSIVWVREQP